jgi:hypothetical protein
MGPPKGGAGLPAFAASMMETMFKGWFTDAIATSFIVAVVFAVVGGLCALLLRSHVREAGAARDRAPATAAVETALTETAAAEADGV